jgi:hypothetical protein
MPGQVVTAISQNTSALKPILAAGSLSGVADLTAALMNARRMGLGPVRVLQFIASGVLGPRSFNGGAATAALGVGAHFLIAFVASVTYYAASTKFNFLVDQPFIWGPLYGVAVFLFMNLIVLPLSATPKRPVTTSGVVSQLLIHMTCVGLAISLAVAWSSK